MSAEEDVDADEEPDETMQYFENAEHCLMGGRKKEPRVFLDQSQTNALFTTRFTRGPAYLKKKVRWEVKLQLITTRQQMQAKQNKCENELGVSVPRITSIKIFSKAELRYADLLK